MKTPVILITFIRPKSTAQILNILNRNKIKNLFIFNDGPRLKSDDKQKILETRSVIDNFKFSGKIFKMYENSYREIGLIDFGGWKGLQNYLNCSYYLLIDTNQEINGIMLYWLSDYGKSSNRQIREQILA